MRDNAATIIPEYKNIQSLPNSIRKNSEYKPAIKADRPIILYVIPNSSSFDSSAQSLTYEFYKTKQPPSPAPKLKAPRKPRIVIIPTAQTGLELS